MHSCTNKQGERLMYPWEVTARDWIGVRFQKIPRPRTSHKELIIGTVPREPFEDLYVEIMDGYDNSLIAFDPAGNMIGAVGFDMAYIAPQYRGRGVLGRMLGERYFRMGTTERTYLRQSVHGTLTDSGLRMRLRAHAYAVQKKCAISPGSVPDDILASLSFRITRQKYNPSPELIERLRLTASESDETRELFRQFMNIVEMERAA